MDSRKFDTAARAWGSGASRRRVLGVLLGVLAGVAGLGVSEVQAAKVGLCHRSVNSENDAFHFISVPLDAVPAHLAHGDFTGQSKAECEGLSG